MSQFLNQMLALLVEKIEERSNALLDSDGLSRREPPKIHTIKQNWGY
jgi:hypothetical protein